MVGESSSRYMCLGEVLSLGKESERSLLMVRCGSQGIGYKTRSRDMLD